MKIIITEEQFNYAFGGKRVMVYYNLHKETFSIRYENRVIMHADYVKLINVEFRVRRGGMLKVRDEKQKNIHAFVIGNLVDYCEYPCEDIPHPKSNLIATYDPYKHSTFIIKGTGEPITSAREVDLANLKNKIYIVKI